jgi:hypothetical protein
METYQQLLDTHHSTLNAIKAKSRSASDEMVIAARRAEQALRYVITKLLICGKHGWRVLLALPLTAVCELSLWLVLSYASRVFLRVLQFFSLHKNQLVSSVLCVENFSNVVSSA